MKSFQAVLRLHVQYLAVISSENVKSIEVVRDGSEAGVRVVFDICDSISEARLCTKSRETQSAPFGS